MVALSWHSLLYWEMTSVMAFAWALEPSALSEPAGQPSPEAEEEPELELLLPGAAVPAGSEPQAAKLSVPTASTAASLEIRDSWFGFADVWSVVMRVLTERRGGPLVVPEAPHLRESAAGRTLPMAGTYASELSARAVPDERPVNADAEVAQGLDEQPGTIPLPRSTRPAQACGRCRSSACTSPLLFRWATRNSPVTSV